MAKLFKMSVSMNPSINKDQLLAFDSTFTILAEKSKEIEVPLRAVRIIRDYFSSKDLNLTIEL